MGGEGFHSGGTFHSPSRPCFSRRPSGGTAFLFPFAGAQTLDEAEAFPIELVNCAVMGEPVQQGGGQGGVTEHTVHCASGRFVVTIKEPFS